MVSGLVCNHIIVEIPDPLPPAQPYLYCILWYQKNWYDPIKTKDGEGGGKKRQRETRRRGEECRSNADWTFRVCGLSLVHTYSRYCTHEMLFPRKRRAMLYPMQLQLQLHLHEHGHGHYLLNYLLVT